MQCIHMYLLYFKLYISDLIANQICNKIIKNLRLLSGALQMLLWASLGADKWRHSRPGVAPGVAEEEGDIRVGITLQSNFSTIISIFS